MIQELLNIPNSLSFARGLLALLLLVDEPFFRVGVVIAAALTDFFDGFLARRWQQISRFGTTLDPAMDKLFVAIALMLFFYEGKLGLVECLCFLFRDVSVLLFTGWLLVSKSFDRWKIQSFVCGKITTALQFLVLLGLCVAIEIPSALYYTMALFGLLSLFELLLLQKKYK